MDGREGVNRDDSYRRDDFGRDDWRDARDEGPSPAEAEREVQRARADMDETIDELVARLKPGNLVSEIFAAVCGSAPGEADASDAIRKVGSGAAKAIARHPMPAALVGVGLLWLAAEQKRGHADGMDGGGEGGIHRGAGAAKRTISRVGETARDTVERTRSVAGDAASKARGAVDSALHATRRAASSVGDAAHRTRDTVSGVAHRTRDVVHDVAGRTGHIAKRTVETTREKAGVVSEKAAETYERHPISVGIAALGLGLLAGVAIPNSRRENRLMGREAQTIRRRAAEKADHAAASVIEGVAEKVTGKAEHVADRIAERAQRTFNEEDRSTCPPGRELGQGPTAERDRDAAREESRAVRPPGQAPLL